ncbi:unnamed protein product [Paramecium octaurelia]|uniref:Uncharacterized protein n=1 Tax=Paramecium octaurelia TaxID=43137 RepID=A0A8S1RS28_PAROT|nr:unnamed protein product [Paramecium octaurelia]
MQNVKQMREKYENIKQLNPNRDVSSRSFHSHTPSKEQYQVAFSSGKKSIDQPNISIGKTLLCSPCYNKRLLNKQQQNKKQESELEKRLLMKQMEQNQLREQQKINFEVGQLSLRKQMEQQNLNISKELLDLHKEKERQLKEQEIQQQNLIIKQNQEILQQEKIEKKKKQHSLHQELSSQIEQQKRLQKIEYMSQSMEFDDPYWRNQAYEEKEQQRRKNYQMMCNNNHWQNHEKEQQKKQQKERALKNKEIDERIKTLQDYHNQLEQEKIEKQQIQHQLILDLNAQVKLKQTKQQAIKLIDQQKQRQRDQEIMQQEKLRKYKEICHKKKVSQEIIESLNKQIEMQKQLNPKQQQEQIKSDFYILKPVVEKQTISCTDCKKQQVPQQLSYA